MYEIHVRLDVAWLWLRAVEPRLFMSSGLHEAVFQMTWWCVRFLVCNRVVGFGLLHTRWRWSSSKVRGRASIRWIWINACSCFSHSWLDDVWCPIRCCMNGKCGYRDGRNVSRWMVSSIDFLMRQLDSMLHDELIERRYQSRDVVWQSKAVCSWMRWCLKGDPDSRRRNDERMQVLKSLDGMVSASDFWRLLYRNWFCRL